MKTSFSDSAKRTPPESIKFLLHLKNGAPISGCNTLRLTTVKFEEAGAINALLNIRAGKSSTRIRIKN